MYTVSGFVPLGSSPLAMPSSGNRSMKRGSVSARGAAVAPGNQPRLSFSSSIGGSLLEQAVNTDTNRGSEALLKHFSLSGSRRRSVASSPTEGSECRARVAAPVVQTQFGFQVQDLQPQNSPQSSPFMPTSENPFSWTQPSGQQQQQGQRPLAKGSSRPGLLSLALTHEEDAIPQPLQQVWVMVIGGHGGSSCMLWEPFIYRGLPSLNSVHSDHAAPHTMRVFAVLAEPIQGSGFDGQCILPRRRYGASGGPPGRLNMAQRVSLSVLLFGGVGERCSIS
jgi:hypothetical protein